MSTDLFAKATKEKVYITDGVYYARTVPIKSGDFAPIAGYVKTTIGEHKVHTGSTVLHDLFMSGSEITEKEYYETELTVVNRIG